MKVSGYDQRPRAFCLYVHSISKHKGETMIKLIIHYPETPEQLEKLDCPTQQKLQWIDAIAQTILERCEGKAQR